MLKFLTILLANAALVGIGYGMDSTEGYGDPNSKMTQGTSYKRISGRPKNYTKHYQNSFRILDWVNDVNARPQKDYAGHIEPPTDNINDLAKRCFGLTVKIVKNSKKMSSLPFKFKQHLRKDKKTIDQAKGPYINQLKNKTFLKRFQGLKELPTNGSVSDDLGDKIPLRYLKKLTNVKGEDLLKRKFLKVWRSLKNVKSLGVNLSRIKPEDFPRLLRLCCFLPNLKKIDFGFVNANVLKRFKDMSNILPQNVLQSLSFDTEEEKNPKEAVENFMSSNRLDKIQLLNLVIENGEVLKEIDLKKFPDLKTLELIVYEKLDSQDLEDLKSSSVSSLKISDYSLNGSLEGSLNLGFLGNFPNLDYFFIGAQLANSKDPSLSNLEALLNLKKLENLTFDERININQNLVDILCKLGNLRYLSLALDCDMSPEDQKGIMQEFAPQLFENLKNLSFLSIDPLPKFVEDDEDLEEDDAQAPQNNVMWNPDAEQNEDDEDQLDGNVLSDGENHDNDEFNLPQNQLAVPQKQRPTFTLPTFTLQELEALFGKSTSKKTLSSEITIQPKAGELTKKPYSGSPYVSSNRRLEFYPTGKMAYDTDSVTFRPKK